MKNKELYIKPLAGFPVKSLMDLIDSLYRTEDNPYFKTYARTTYKDKDCTKVECAAGRRSFEDLLCLAQTYYPETTEVDLMNVLAKIGIKFYFCNAIRKLVFHHKGYFYVSEIKNCPTLNFPYAEGTYTLENLQSIYERANQ